MSLRQMIRTQCDGEFGRCRRPVPAGRGCRAITAMTRPSSHPAYQPPQLNHLQMFRAFRPVVDPADDQVAALERVFMVDEVAAGVFELDLDSLPFVLGYLAKGFAVGEGGLDSFYLKAELFRGPGKDIRPAR